jgi:ribosome-associated protein
MVPRRKTKPSKGAIERRLAEKSGRGTIKKNRGRPGED